MRRGTTVSALAAVGFLAGVSAGQPPAVTPKVPDTNLTDTLIQKALANDPDVQVARAKLALAEAEVAKARQAAVTRVIALRDTVEQHRQAVARQTELLTFKERLAKANQLSREELLAAQEQVAAARAALARAETELRLLTGDGPKVPGKTHGSGIMSADTLAALLADGMKLDDAATIARWNDLARHAAAARPAAGPIPDRIRAALDKKVRLGNKGDGIALDAAMEVFKKEAGLDVPVRPTPSPMPRIVLEGEELPVGAWFQLFEDHGGLQGTGFAFYVREYGLLVANRQTAPPGAMTLTEFWRDTRPAAAAGQRHEHAHDNLPQSIKAKVGDEVMIRLPIKNGDVGEAKVRSDDPAAVVRLEIVNGMAAVVIRADRPVRTRCDWQVTDAAGRAFNGPLAVEFE